MNLKKSAFFFFFTVNVFASETLWHAHEAKNMSEELMLKKTLSYILTQNKSLAGQAFLKLDTEAALDTYNYFFMNPEYKKRIGENQFRSYKTFADQMNVMANQVADGNVILDAKNDALIRTAYFFKKMRSEIDDETCSEDTSYNNVKASDYQKSARKYHDMALSVCSGDISGLHLFLDKIPKKIVDGATRFLTNKSCEDTVRNDILEIVNPYDNPLTSPGQEATLEGTGIYLAGKIVPDKNYEQGQLFKALMKIQNYEVLPASHNLHDIFTDKNWLGLSSIDAIRMISLANHNHGLEFFMTNAIIDLSSDDVTAIKNVKAAYKGLNHLYGLINKHEIDRKEISEKDQDQLDRKYHYWGGVMITCELMERGYNSHVAEYVSGKLGETYERGSVNERTKNEDKEMKNDMKLHHLGAAYGRKICK